MVTKLTSNENGLEISGLKIRLIVRISGLKKANSNLYYDRKTKKRSTIDNNSIYSSTYLGHLA